MVRMQNRNRLLSCKQFIIVSYVTSTNFNSTLDRSTKPNIFHMDWKNQF